MFKEKETEEIIKMVLGDTEVIQDSTGIKIKAKKENYTLDDLKQKLINYLYEKDFNIYKKTDYVLLQWIFSEKN